MGHSAWNGVLILILGLLAVVDACFFRTSSSTWNPDPFLNSSDHGGGYNLPIGLDKDTISVVQQTLVKTLISLGKLRFHCPPRENGTYPDLLDCRKYYNCISGNYTVGLCEPGYGYEVLAKACIPSERVNLCHKVEKLGDQFKCQNETGLRVYEGSCEKFILCVGDEMDGGAAYASSCNHGDIFDQRLMLCLPENEANCTITTNSTSTSVLEGGTTATTISNGTESSKI